MNTLMISMNCQATDGTRGKENDDSGNGAAGGEADWGAKAAAVAELIVFLFLLFYWL